MYLISIICEKKFKIVKNSNFYRVAKMKFKKYIIVVSLEKILHTPHIKVITEIPVARAAIAGGVSPGPPSAAPQVLVTTLMILFPLIKYCV